MEKESGTLLDTKKEQILLKLGTAAVKQPNRAMTLKGHINDIFHGEYDNEIEGETVEQFCGRFLAPSTVDHPKHYTTGKIEVWDFILDQQMNYLEGNIVKYVCRYKGKNGLEDLLKARAYLDKLIAGTQ